ncbi:MULTISPECIES: 16S rRNA (guanine(527)-N(7))-methyltransferase RsmG [Exiguobacterium]|uniref:16S rRNA (guanine(527)-N(7))-methyltransferase RsmG n=1 Tax=Exiguobacterium TaxID=33986 RepID=UPI001BE6594E|nr:MULTISPECIES: 16S rRNA (guanine(527)-N(7))-methyltransferase RsmG [unclassified Exiguobacterium]
MNQSQFIEALQAEGFELSEKQLAQFELYFEMLVEWNEKMNLTAITDKEEVYLKHFYDSLSAAFHFDFSNVETVCDVGAGAGFPSLPLKILFPHLHVTIIDSLNKRITFLNELALALGLEGVAFHHGRAEEFGKNRKFREQFDVVTARAVARMTVLAEYCLPLAKVGGTFVALKAAKVSDELIDAKNALAVLGGEIKTTHQFLLPGEMSERNIVIVDKLRKTPGKYPRKAGTPAKEPLI